MRHIYLSFFILVLIIFISIVVVLFLDFKETFFYFSFDLWLQLFFHVVHLEILTFEIFQRMTDIFLCVCVVFIDRFLYLHCCFTRIIANNTIWTYQWRQLAVLLNYLLVSVTRQSSCVVVLRIYVL